MKQDRETSGNNASSWSVDEVIRFVQEADPQTLGPHVDLFRKHVSISVKLTDVLMHALDCNRCGASHMEVI